MFLEEQVKDVIIQTLSVKSEELNNDQSLYDCLGVDSTEIVDLKVALEKKFALKIDTQEITKDTTVKQIISLIETKEGAV